MLPEDLSSIQRLLLLTTHTDCADLNLAIQRLRQFLPTAELTLHQISSDSLQRSEILQHRSFDAVILFTKPFQSPYSLAYLCYLRGIPIRIGQSQEFGGSVLSHPVQPTLENLSPPEYHLHLLDQLGFSSVTTPL